MTESQRFSLKTLLFLITIFYPFSFKNLVFSTFLIIKYYGLQIIKGNAQSEQNTNFVKYKILQWEVSVVFFTYLRKLDEDSTERELVTGNFTPFSSKGLTLQTC